VSVCERDRQNHRCVKNDRDRDRETERSKVRGRHDRDERNESIEGEVKSDAYCVREWRLWC
jgi:hypothetical protein